MNENIKINNFYVRAEKLIEQIKEKNDEIIKLLTQYEPHKAAIDEINRSIGALDGARKEFNPIIKPHTDLNISTFFPLNLPLYSLVLFGIMPSAFSKNVYIRPPEVMEKTLQSIWDLLDITKLFPELSLKITPRHIFVSLYASESDLIIFTGKYANALDIHKKCPGSLLLYNGSGVNPFIVFENADLELALDKAVEMRCFNSGQDCAGPDAFFIEESISKDFIDGLTKRLLRIKVGATVNSSTDIGPTIKPTYIAELVEWMQKNKPEIVYGGEIDIKNQYVNPTISVTRLHDKPNLDFHEFFAPFFNLVIFKEDEELLSATSMTAFTDRGMYISVFGDNENVEPKLNNVKILKNCIVNDVEKGNDEYGGYGDRANFLLYGDQKITRPVLVSRDIHLMIPNE